MMMNSIYIHSRRKNNGAIFPEKKNDVQILNPLICNLTVSSNPTYLESTKVPSLMKLISWTIKLINFVCSHFIFLFLISWAFVYFVVTYIFICDIFVWHRICDSNCLYYSSPMANYELTFDFAVFLQSVPIKLFKKWFH